MDHYSNFPQKLNMLQMRFPLSLLQFTSNFNQCYFRKILSVLYIYSEKYCG